MRRRKSPGRVYNYRKKESHKRVLQRRQGVGPTKAIPRAMDDGGDITQIGSLDQSRFDYLLNYDTLKDRNAQQVFQEMEWE